MRKNVQKIVDECSKDDQSKKRLLELFEDLITEKERAERHLSLLEDSIRSDYDSILITELNMEKPGPKIVYVNDGFTEMTGYTREEAIGNTPRMLQGEKTDRAVLDKLKKRLKEGQAFFGHTVNYRKDGTEFINQWDIHPLTNSEGEITHWVSYQHDITERKRSEEKLVDTQVEFDKLVEESKKTLIDLDEQGNIVTSNKSFRDLVGYNDEELKKLKFWDILEEEFIEQFKLKFSEFKPSDFDGASYSLELKNKQGKSLEVKARARLLTSSGQTIVRVAFENKSLQKRIMSMLSQRDSDYSRVFGKKTDYSYKVVPSNGDQFKFDYVSNSFSEITGIASSELGIVKECRFIHKDDLDKFRNHLKIVLSGKPNTEEYRIKSKDGSYVPVIDYAKPEWDADRTSVISVKGATSTEVSSERKPQ